MIERTGLKTEGSPVRGQTEVKEAGHGPEKEQESQRKPTAQTRWCTPLVLTPGTQRQEISEFEATLV